MERTASARLGRDAVSLHLETWLPNGRSLATVVVVHGYCEHAGRYRDFAARLARAGFTCLLLDLRGHGLSEGPRGHVEHFDAYIDDVTALIDDQPKDQPLFVFGHSMGGLIALLTARRSRRPLRGLLLSNPYLENALAIGFGKRLLGRVAARLAPRLRAPSGISAEALSREEAAHAALRQDPLMSRSATAGWFAAVTAAQAEAAANDCLPCPLWLGLGLADSISSVAANEAWFARSQGPDREVARYEGALHELLHDSCREQVLADMLAWLARHCLGQPQSIPADTVGRST